MERKLQYKNLCFCKKASNIDMWKLKGHSEKLPKMLKKMWLNLPVKTASKRVHFYLIY